MGRKLVKIHVRGLMCRDARRKKRTTGCIPCLHSAGWHFVTSQKSRSGSIIEICRASYCDACAKLIQEKYPDLTGGPGS